MLSILILGCRSRKKIVQNSDLQKNETAKIDTNVVVSNEKKIEQIDKDKKKETEQVKYNDGDLVIEGETDTLKDFRYHTIIEGDTIADIFISGNSNFVIKNRWKQLDRKEIKESVVKKLNVVADIARKSVAQSTIKSVSEKIRKDNKEVVTKGTTAPMYLIFGVSVLFIIGLVFLWFKFKK